MSITTKSKSSNIYVGTFFFMVYDINVWIGACTHFIKKKLYKINLIINIIKKFKFY